MSEMTEEEIEMLKKIDEDIRKKDIEHIEAEEIDEPIKPEKLDEYYREHPSEAPLLTRLKHKREDARAKRLALKDYYIKKVAEEKFKAQVRGANFRAKEKAKKFEKTASERALGYIAGSKKNQSKKIRVSPSHTRPIIIHTGMPVKQKKPVIKKQPKSLLDPVAGMSYNQPNFESLLGSTNPNRSFKKKKKRVKPLSLDDMLGF